ncbi:MAG: DUF3256 family protein [Muribaculaceae bacterium]|nr:DUF3256 family protein [Muribaculaceae bacterium]
MNKTLYTVVAGIILILGVCFQVSAVSKSAKQVKADTRAFFKEDPAGIFDLIPKLQRLDMLDYFDSNIDKEVENALNGKSKLLAATTEYVCVKISKGVTIELWAPQPEQSSMIIANFTYSIPTSDGNIKVFSANGYPLNSNWKPSTIEDFMLKIEKNSSLSKADVIALADIPIVYYTINRNENTITAHLNIKEYLSAEDYDQISSYFKNSITYKVKPAKNVFSIIE